MNKGMRPGTSSKVEMVLFELVLPIRQHFTPRTHVHEVFAIAGPIFARGELEGLLLFSRDGSGLAVLNR
jgi:hypothetical protein